MEDPTTQMTKLPYSYRDAANYKQHDYIYLDGPLGPTQIQLLKETLSDGEFFIPFDLQLGIAELQSRLESFPCEDDHVYHVLELESLELVGQAPQGCKVLPVSQFMAAFAAISGAEGWDVVGAMERLDLDA